ncbi:MAG: ABC transporter ATP-binding protein/permease [Betaproteobacteria bacterium]|nr:ABC transporter ATP-binding protein/permease [Betaproteobacteria bacterium]
MDDRRNEKRRTRRFLRAFWNLAKPYWTSKQRGTGVILLATVVGLSLAMVWMEVQFNGWNRDFYNTFENRDQAEFFRQLGMFTVLAVTYIIIFVYRVYFQQMLQIEWRTWLTERFLGRWMDEQAHYRIQVLAAASETHVPGVDNPDQRIADDLRIFVDYTLSLSLGLLSAVVTLFSFLFILWTLSGPLEVGGITIPGYMVWVAVVYAIAGSWLTHVIGRPLIGLDFNQQRYEADFRFSLVRLRENSEGVALYRGEGPELAGFKQRFGAVIGNWWSLMKKRKQLGWFTSFYGQLAIIFPYVVVSPRFFAGQMPLGGIFQTASAFGQVQGALSWFINAYTDFATWKATVDRLVGFSEVLERVAEEARSVQGERAEGGAPGLAAEHLSLELPGGRSLLSDASVALQPHDDTLVTGPSGAGKSTLFRALAGIWPYWKGRIQLPKGARLLFLPQKPYLPIGTLKHAAAYPAESERFGDGEVAQALADVGLEQLAGELERSDNWAQVLSGGEQQRLAFARALLIKPDWLFLDEATASLPEEDQAALYRLLKERLPGTTLVSIGHRASLEAFHKRRLAWRPGPSASLTPA